MEITTIFGSETKLKCKCISSEARRVDIKPFHESRGCLFVSTEALNNLNTHEIKIFE